MGKKRKRRSGNYPDFVHDDPCSGLEPHLINSCHRVSRYTYSMSIFDADNVAVDITSPGGKRSYKKVSIMGNVRKVNGKTSKINGYNERLKGR